MSVRWSGLNTRFSPGEILVLPKLEATPKEETIRILIADDDPMIPDMLSERLRLSIGEDRVTLLTTNSAEKALELLFEQPVDLLLTDYDFSQGGRAEGMNGLALLRAIEQHRIVVTTIFMTGFGDEEVAKNAILEGASDYLTKPVLKGLTQVVERCIERHQDKLQVAALRNAATLLEISEALNQPGGQGRGAELILEASLKAIDCDLAWVRMSSPIEGVPELRRVLTKSNETPLPDAGGELADDPAARFATADEIAARFNDRSPTRLWIRPLVMQRSEQGEQKVIGELCVAYFERGHRFHPGRQQTLEVLAHHTEGLLTQRFLRHDLERSFSQTIQVLVQALEMHDEYTAGHSDWVGVYARLGGLALGWDRRAVARAGHAGLLHDIGKVRLDSSMINHPGKLTDEQFEHFRAHPVVGAEMLKPLTSMEDILPAVCWHHERFEGGGYPSGVAASLLPPLARLMCIADSYDAMTSHRAYRRARSHHEAIAELRRCAGTQFDPEMVEPFILATAAFRRMLGAWASALIRERKMIAPQVLESALAGLFDTPFSDHELGLDVSQPVGTNEGPVETSLPFDLEDLAQVFFSLESSLEQAAALFLASSGDAPSATELIQRLEEGAQRSDQRIERLIAEVYSEQRPE